MPRITPNLWFDMQALEAAEFYISVFPDSKVDFVAHYPKSNPHRGGEVLTVDFTLDRQRFTAINGGPEHSFTEAVSFLIECADQDEIDRYWSTLSEGGEEGPCGWLKDRYGLSWQVIPTGFEELMTDPDEDRRDRAFGAVMSMGKLDRAKIWAAADGD